MLRILKVAKYKFYGMFFTVPYLTVAMAEQGVTGRCRIQHISLGGIVIIFVFFLLYRRYLAIKLKSAEGPCALLDTSCPVGL